MASLLCSPGCGGGLADTDAATEGLDARRDELDSGRDAVEAGHDAARVDSGPLVTYATRVYTAQDDGQIVVHTLSEVDGSLTELGRTAVPGGSSFLAIDGAGARGAAVLEGGGEVVALAYAPGSGLVREVGARRSSEGGGPTHVSVDRSGQWAFVANYGGGTVASFRFAADGSLDAASDTEAPGARAHMIATSPANRWALVPCLGDDRVAVLAFDASSGTLAPSSVHASADGAGPRHFAITRDGTFVYVNGELDSTVEVLAFSESTGVLTHVQTITTLPPGFSGTNSTAEILLGPDERYLFVSNRGHDSIAVFRVQPDHTLEAHGHAALEARRPRSFAIDPSGTWLLAGAQDDDVVVSFRIGADGSLTRTGASPTTGSPTFVGIFAIPS